MVVKFSKTLCLWTVGTVLAFGAPAVESTQTKPGNEVPMWKEARRPDAKGTRIKVPKQILEELVADPNDCMDPADSRKMDAYKIPNGDTFLIAVWGRGTCFCSPTGNCDFWIYRERDGKFEQLLSTGMTNDFGFLERRTNGYRDFIRWSHGSAFDSGALHFSFNGERYTDDCSWDETYEGHELPNGGWKWNPKPKITSDSCRELATIK